VLINRRATSHLVRGDKPFVATRKNIISALAPMNPPRIAISAESDKPSIHMLAELQRLLIGHSVEDPIGLAINFDVDLTLSHPLALLTVTFPLEGLRRLRDPSAHPVSLQEAVAAVGVPARCWKGAA
jgi:hypothetical protein